MHKLIATGLGIGYIRKGGGTVASVLCCGAWYLTTLGSTQLNAAQSDAAQLNAAQLNAAQLNAAQLNAAQPGGYLPVLITIIITAVGIWSADVVEQQWGKDSYRVVIDEIAGMCLSLLFIPIHEKSLLAGLVLFRFFDILKPLGIRKLEQVRGGWGVMLDDLLAGLYANLLLRIALIMGIL